MKITRNALFVGIWLLLQVVNLFVLSNIESNYIRFVICSFFLLFIPGYLTMLILKIRKNDHWENLVYTVGFSTAFLIFIGLLTNWTFTSFGISKPLSPPYLIITINIFVTLMLFIAWLRNRKLVLQVPLLQLPAIDWVFMAVVVSFPILAIYGAIALNNYQLNQFTPLMLGLVGLWVFCAFVFREKLSRNVFPFALYFISLALLLMTSMRGWYTTGHDNQLETFVFQLTKSDYKWDIGKYRDPYNASMSITILPTVYYSLTGIDDVYIYKTIYQVIFAFIGISLFLLFSRYTTKFIAFLAVFSFISFPTFINDMPMLNRQEIAMFFFSLILLGLFAPIRKTAVNKIAFFSFGGAMVLSHYSTTYITIAVFSIVYFLYFILFRTKVLHGFKQLVITFKIRSYDIYKQHKRLSLNMVLGLLVLTLIWNAQLTNTTAGLFRVVEQTITNINKMFSQDLKSGSVLYSLFSWKQLDKEELLGNYIKESLAEVEKEIDKSQLYDEAIYSQYPITLINDHKDSLTVLGKWLSDKNIDPFKLNFYMRQAIAKLIQILMLIGAIVLLKGSKFVKNLDPEYMLLILASFIAIALFILLPVLSTEYGTRRLFQQLLMISSLPLVVGLLAITGLRLATLAIIVIFLSLSGFIPNITGGFYPQLHLENSGDYYDSYLTHKSEVISMKWLAQHYDKRFVINTDSTAHAKMSAQVGIFPYKVVLPAVITKDAYVYLDYTLAVKNETPVSYKGDHLIYKYPINFLEDNKNLIYSNAETLIYK